MILVVGTKRSGTSMWMQVLRAAGFPSIGQAFPGEWESRIKDANPHGFFESIFREGIYYRTNPHPRTGVFLSPDQTRHHVVKVFIPGLVRSDLAFVDKVVATMRHYADYAHSVERLYAMEADAISAAGEQRKNRPEMPPIIEWWMENFTLISDAVTRRYPIHLTTHENILRDPTGTVTETLEWIGDGNVNGNVNAGVAAVKPETGAELPPRGAFEFPYGKEIKEVFDELFARIHVRTPLDPPFVKALNDVDARLRPEIEAAVKAVAQYRREKQLAAQTRPADKRPAT